MTPGSFRRQPAARSRGPFTSRRGSARCVVNGVRAAVAAAVDGHGVTRLYTYHVAERVQDGSLTLLLRDAEPPAMPVHLITPEGRTSVPKVRSFLDFAVPRLRAEFARLSTEALALKG